tara:strand:+ start:360 stop:1109 length:750 start_codon:yes stop_codon:yes gene_type:complete
MQEPSYSEIEFTNPYKDRPYVISNMIISADGNTLFTNEDSTGLGSAVDRRLMGELRFHVDAVINGAETLRIAGSSSLIRSEELVQNRLANSKTAHPIACVLTNSGNLPLENRFFTSKEFESLVFLDESAPQEKFEELSLHCKEVIRIPKNNRAHYLLNYLHEHYDVSIALLEGGPMINGIFFENNLIDEHFSTVSPQVFIPRNPFTSIRPTESYNIMHQELELLSMQVSEKTGEIFTRYKNKSAVQKSN